MATMLDYRNMSVEILKATSNPAAHTGIALAIVMRSDDTTIPDPVSESLCRKLMLAEHSSVFEHVVYTFLIENVSRSFLAQITRQRTASPTSGSQHYQDYSDYPMMLDLEGAAHHKQTDEFKDSLNMSLDTYTSALNGGVAKEEARQVLPNACAVNYLWTIDARNLFFFLRQRLCNRNVLEMRIFANRVLSLVQDHFPELFNNAGPQCTSGICFQGALNMQCDARIWSPNSVPKVTMELYRPA